MIEYLAMIAAWVGEKDLAGEQLAAAVMHSIFRKSVAKSSRNA
jgi:hypothetical protein